MNRGVPIPLYLLWFGRFLPVIRRYFVEISLKPEDYSATRSLFDSPAMLYNNKAWRLEATNVFLDNAIPDSIKLRLPGMKGVQSVLWKALCVGCFRRRDERNWDRAAGIHHISVAWTSVFTTRTATCVHPPNSHQYSSYLTWVADEGDSYSLLRLF
jgi:hypothetical protein